MTSPNLLFHKYDFSEICRNVPVKVKKAADELSEQELMDGTEEEVAERLVNDHSIEVPLLNLEKLARTVEEVDQDVSHDPRRMMFDQTGPCYVKATQISFKVPFTGNSEVFFCRPSTWTLNPPRAEVEDDCIVISIIRTDHDKEAFQAAYNDTIQSIEKCLNTLRSDASQLKSQIRQAALTQVQQRLTKREKDKNLLEELGT